MSTPAAEFVRAHTRFGVPPLVPEVRLRLTDDVVALWEEMETAAPPFWAAAWAGGQGLARHVLDTPALVAGRTVLDVASGSGLVAIAAALAGAAQVTAVDVDPLAAAAVALNSDANGVVVTGLLEDLLDGDGAGAAVVLAGDVCYDRAMAERVLGFLGRARRRGATVLVGDPGRAYLPTGRFTSRAVYDVPVPEMEGVDVRRCTVWELP